jgi:hypothetical protein
MSSPPKLGSPANVLWIVITAIAVLIWSFGPQTWDWYEANRMGKLQPCLSLVPQPLTTEVADSAPGTTQSYSGYEFEVPGLNPLATEIRHMVNIAFGEGEAVSFWDPDDLPHLFDNGIASHRHRSVKDEFEFVIGKDAARSNYDLLLHTLTITPEQISPTLSKRDALRRLTLLRMKSYIYCQNAKPMFYSFDSKDLRCIQIGEPGPERTVEVKCFDPADREVDFHFGAKKDSGAMITQLQINRVIQTLRPTNKSSVEPTKRN